MKDKILSTQRNFLFSNISHWNKLTTFLKRPLLNQRLLAGVTGLNPLAVFAGVQTRRSSYSPLTLKNLLIRENNITALDKEVSLDL